MTYGSVFMTHKVNRKALWYSERWLSTLRLKITENRFYHWRLRNPGVHIGLSPEGLKLLGENIDALEWYIKVHPENIRAVRILKRLRDLIHDTSPTPPSNARKHSRAFFLHGALYRRNDKKTSLLFTVG